MAHSRWNEWYAHNEVMKHSCWWVAQNEDQFAVARARASTTHSHQLRASKPFIRNPASREIVSDSVLLCETADCFLHIQEIGTNAISPKMHHIPPEVYF